MLDSGIPPEQLAEPKPQESRESNLSLSPSRTRFPSPQVLPLGGGFHDEEPIMSKRTSTLDWEPSRSQHQIVNVLESMIGGPDREVNRVIHTMALFVMALGVVGVILIYLRSVLIPFFMAILIYFLLIPIVNFLTHEKSSVAARCDQNFTYRLSMLDWSRERTKRLLCDVSEDTMLFKMVRGTILFFTIGKFPRWLAVIVAIMIALLALALVVWIAFDAAAQLAGDSDKYVKRIESIILSISKMAAGFGIKISTGQIIAKIRQIPFDKIILSALQSFLSLIQGTAIMLIFVIYLLMERGPKSSSGQDVSDLNLQALGMKKEINRQIRKYIGVKTFVSALKGFSIGIILWSCSIPLAGVFGLLTFVLNFIPNIGSTLATILPVTIVLIDPDLSTIQRVTAVVLPVLTQFSVGFLVEPLMFGGKLQIHPVVILLSLTIWGSLWGITGMILSVPITAVIKIFCEHIDHYIPRYVARILEGKLYMRNTKKRLPRRASKARKSKKVNQVASDCGIDSLGGPLRSDTDFRLSIGLDDKKE